MLKKIAAGITWIMSPLLIPTYAAVLLLYSEFHFSMFSWEAKRFILILTFLSTAILPAFTLAITRVGNWLQINTQKKSDHWSSMIFIGLYYYLGFFFLNKIPMYAIFKIMLLAGAVLVILLMIITIKWNISHHMAAAGGLFGLMLALSLRLGANPVLLLTSILLLSGLTGTALMVRNKHTLTEVITAFPLGFTVNFLIFYLL
jgi:hypothetical protein